MTFIVSGFRADSSQSKCLTVSYANLAVGRVANSAMEVLVVVRWFGMKINDQTVPVAYCFSVEERDGLLGPVGGKIDSCMMC